MNGIDRVTQMCRQVAHEEADIVAAENNLKARKSALLAMKRVDLPELMAEFGLKMFALDDGTQIEIKGDVEARISDDNRDQAHAWLASHGFGGLIKTQVIVEFGRGEKEAADACVDKLRAEHDNVACCEAVHPQTLRAFVREQMSQGNALPLSLFGVQPFSFAKITFKKG